MQALAYAPVQNGECMYVGGGWRGRRGWRERDGGGGEGREGVTTLQPCSQAKEGESLIMCVMSRVDLRWT